MSEVLRPRMLVGQVQLVLLAGIHTGDDPGVLGAKHLLFESLAEDDARLVLVEVADDDSDAVLLQTNGEKVMHGSRQLSPPAPRRR